MAQKLLNLLLPVLFAALISGLQPVPAQAESVAVRLERGERGVYKVEGRFLVSASPCTAWAVLTDYEHIGRFVSSVSFSRVISRSKGEILLEQGAVCGLFFFSRQIHVL